MSEATALDDADPGVDAFESGVGQSELDGGEDALEEVLADAFCEVDEGFDAAGSGGVAPFVEVDANLVGLEGLTCR